MRRAAIVALVVALAAAAGAAAAAELPSATRTYLKSLGLPDDRMAGLEQDLAVPDSWVAGALKEGTVKVNGTWSAKQFQTLDAPFVERYPKIKVVYTIAGSMNSRAIAPLVAFKQGQYLTDVITGFGGAALDFAQDNALADVTELPGFANQVAGSNDADGKWAAMRLRYWCIGYNTNLIKPGDLPRDWTGLIDNPVWHDGNLGIGNRPQLWLLMLRSVNSREWIEDFVTKFFTVVKPQFRNEGMNALLGLMAAGEVRAALPTAEYGIKLFADKGAPVGWHCPEPVPLAPSQIGIMNGNPHPNAARLWANWMLSREAQLAQFVADGSPPSHKALQTREFIIYADQVVGRHLVQPDERYKREVFEMWEKYWK